MPYDNIISNLLIKQVHLAFGAGLVEAMPLYSRAKK